MDEETRSKLILARASLSRLYERATMNRASNPHVLKALCVGYLPDLVDYLVRVDRLLLETSDTSILVGFAHDDDPVRRRYWMAYLRDVRTADLLADEVEAFCEGALARIPPTES